MGQGKRRLSLLAMAAGSGLLAAAAWPSAGIAPLLFVAFVPLLLVEDAAYRNPAVCGRAFHFLCAYLAFFLFNLLTTWWVKYASLFGAVAAITCNALFMALVFQLFHFTRRRLGNSLGFIALPVFWLAFEHLHMDWDLSWPWLTLGNGFAGWPRMIQWYEFTGVLGGSLWIWSINLLIALMWITRKTVSYRNHIRQVVALVILLGFPLAVSMVRYATYREHENPVEVAVIQPNIDPYNEKFSSMSPEKQLNRILDLAGKAVRPGTRFVVAPETAMPEGIWEEELSFHPDVEKLLAFQKQHHNVTWIIGLASNRFYPDSNSRSTTARKFTRANGYYDSYNTAMQLEADGRIGLYHKSKLVPGVEKMPFPELFKYLEGFAIDLGGISGSLGMQEHSIVFTDSLSGIRTAPVICYESVYGDYLAGYVRDGAQLIFIITNDGWWSDTPGYRQHLKYATLRAIETRRSIARSANTGISCFINQRGDILQATAWWQPAAITMPINANDARTFFVQTGDLIGRVAIACTLVFPVLFVIGWRKKRMAHND